MRTPVEDSSMEEDRHKALRQIAKATYGVPGSRTSARVLSRFALHSIPLSLRNRQRIYNFVAADTIPRHNVSCVTPLPSGRTVKLRLDLRDDLSRRWYYWGYSGYEQATVRFFWKLLQSKCCVFDIGANIGYYTLLAASVLEGRGEVHAFEPSPGVIEWLSANVRLNSFQCVSVNQAAVAEADGEMPLFLPSDGAGTNASLVENFTRQDTFVMAKTIRLDSYCAKNVTRPIDLIKVDAEGAEISVLRGSGTLLDQWMPDIICEVLPPFENELDQFFSDLHYRKFLITDNGLQEKRRLEAHHEFRDYYLSRAPILL